MDEVDRFGWDRGDLVIESGPPQLRVVGDATPRTLYVRRDVKNGADIIRWAKEQGFKEPVLATDLHVTVAYSRAPVDWMKMGSSWQDEVKITKSGPRLIEKFGDATVLLVSSDELRWRHEAMREAGATWDFPDYQPHITISYEGEPPENVEPYQGEIILGPEIFEGIDQ